MGEVVQLSGFRLASAASRSPDDRQNEIFALLRQHSEIDEKLHFLRVINAFADAFGGLVEKQTSL